MKTILFPTDFSAISLNAFGFALHLARDLDASVISLYAYDLPVIMPDNGEGYPVTTKNYHTDGSGYYREGIHKLKAVAKGLQLTGISIQHLFANGEAVEEIMNAIDLEQPDFVVMGTKGAGDAAVTLFGSTAEKTISRCGAPVFVIPPGCIYNPFTNILFLTHYPKMETRKLEELYSLVLPLNANITVLEVTEARDASDQKYIRRWKEHFEGKPITFHYRSQATMEEILEAFLQEHKLSLLAMQAHNKNFFKRMFAYSLSKKLLYYSTVPLLFLPE